MMPDTAQTPTLSNAAFLTHLGEDRPAGSSLWVTCFTGSPDLTDASNWEGQPLTPSTPVDQWGGLNTYFSVANLKPNIDGEILRRRVNFASLAALVVDDVLLDDVLGQISWCLETSPGKFQIGIFLDQADPDTANRDLCDRLIGTLASATGADASGNNCVRYVRLPVGTNHKARQSGPAAHRMHRWAAGVRLPLAEAASVFGVDLDTLRQVKSAPVNQAGNIVLPAQLAEAKSALAALDADQYDSWVTMGMALHSTGLPEAFGVWCEWSANSSKYRQEDQSPKWQSFSVKRDKAVSIRTLFARAQAAGWKNPMAKGNETPSGDATFTVTPGRQFGAEFKLPEYVIDGVLVRGYLYALTGKSNSGKTAIGLEAAACVGSGSFFGVHQCKKGRVLYLAGENPDDIRLRVKAYLDSPLNGNFRADCFENVTFVHARFNLAMGLEKLSTLGEFDLVVVDGKTAFFSGDDENSNAQAYAQATLLRSLTRIPGLPAVLVLCHPNGLADSSETLKPRGGTAFLNEIDGNLTAVNSGEVISLHWNKIRGPDFPAIPIKLHVYKFPTLKTNFGSSVTAVLAQPIKQEDAEQQIEEAIQDEDRLLSIMEAGGSMRIWAIKLGWINASGQPNTTRISRCLMSLKEDKLVRKYRKSWALTKAGKMQKIGAKDV